MALREKIARKAKEKACISLHELTTPAAKNTTTVNPLTGSPSILNSPSNVTAASNAGRKNHRSYKPFSETNNQQQSDEEKSENEYETPKKQTRTRRKGQGATSTAKEKPNKTTSHRQQQQQQAHEAGELSSVQGGESSSTLLFTQIYNGQVSMQAAVDDWIELYKKDKETAMLDLIQFLVRSSGCKAVHLINSKEMLRSKEFTDCINELIENFNEEEEPTSAAAASASAANTGEIYPLIQTSLQARRFKSNFCEFVQLLINQCQYSIVYDQFMVDILITFLIALADSQVRAFRHTATLAVLKIMTALVDVLLSLSISKDACQRQYENERQKAQVKRANDRIEMLISKRKEIEENEYDIQNFINFIFKAVFIHRYRDVCADIRCICINEIGEWMKKCPEKFLDDTFLKYIGWTLYDRVGECRLKCLQALHPLYEQDDLVAKLELFTSRFKNRIVEMSLDKEYDVSVSAIKLLTKIVTINDAALEDKDCENIYELVYHSNRQIAQAAGEFLNQKLFVKVENPVIEFRRGKKQSENSSFIQLLVQFLIESELHDHPTYLVDAMWDTHEMLKDWECMTDLLLEDPINPEDVLTDTHERYLIEIMCCCVKQAATGEYPISRRTAANRRLTAKETKQVQDDKTELTQHFITTLPDLLTKYIADSEKLIYLLQIVSHFDLNQYTLRRQEKNLDRLLKLLQEIVNKHNDAALLEECSKALSYLCDEESSIYSKCNITRSAVLDDLVNKLANAMMSFRDRDEVDENDMYPLLIALKRLSAFADNHDITRYDLVDYTLTILKWAVYNEGFGHDLVKNALSLGRNILAWNMYKINQDLNAVDVNGTLVDGTSAEQSKLGANTRDLIEYTAKLNKKFHKLCSKLFVNENDDPLIEQEAYFEMCDLLLMFSVNLLSIHKDYKPLVLECSTNDINLMCVYVMNNVFTQEARDEKADTAENIEKLHKRRCILAAFCKLIAYNCVHIKYAAEIFRGYIKYSNSYGDIIKQLLSSCREISKVNTAKTIALALQREYNEAVMNSWANKSGSISSRVDRNSIEFSSLKELAHRFCLSFGPEASVKSREAIMAIHQEAITYANEPPSNSKQAPNNLPFLEVITEFSSRLTANDKKSIMAELDRKFASRANKIEENGWQSYYTYRISLMEDYHPVSMAQPTAATTTATTTAQPTTNVPLANSTLLTTTTVNNNNTNKRTLTENANANNALGAAESSTIAGSSHDYLSKKQSNELNNHVSNPTDDITNKNARKRKQPFNISGIAKLDKTPAGKSRFDDDDGDDENVEDPLNTHAESTLNDLECLKLSTINHHAESTTTNGTRLTRSARLGKPTTSTTLRGNQQTNKNIMVDSGANNKRSRSPLVTNNSINESIVETNVLTSTRIELNKLAGPTKSSIAITPINRLLVVDDLGQTTGDDNNLLLNDDQPNSKRKRKSTDPNQDQEIENQKTFKPVSVA